MTRGVWNEEQSVKRSLHLMKIGKLNYNSLFPHLHPVPSSHTHTQSQGEKVAVDGVCSAPCLPLPIATPHPGTNSDLLHLGAFSPFPLQVLKLVNRLAG